MQVAFRYVILVLALGLLGVLHVGHALAFGPADAATVAKILEELAPARGEAIYYDGEAADEWYEFDQEESGLIPAAGISREGWRDAYDKTLKGLIALIPPAEFEAIHKALGDRVKGAQGLTLEAKQDLLKDMRVLVEGLRALRNEGQAYAEQVRPFAGRLRKLAGF